MTTEPTPPEPTPTARCRLPGYIGEDCNCGFIDALNPEATS